MIIRVCIFRCCNCQSHSHQLAAAKQKRQDFYSLTLEQTFLETIESSPFTFHCYILVNVSSLWDICPPWPNLYDWWEAQTGG